MFNEDVRYLGVIDDPVHLAPASIHEAGHVLPVLTLERGEVILDGVRRNGQGYSPWHLTLDAKDSLAFGQPLSDQATLTLYRVDCKLLDGGPRRAWEKLIEDGDPYPDYIISVGPRGGIKRERC